MNSTSTIAYPVPECHQHQQHEHRDEQPVVPIAKSGCKVRAARLGDLPYIESLTNKLSYELGFIPRIALVNRIESRRGGGVTMAIENDELAGFLHYGSTRSPTVRIFQAGIQYDARRRHHGQSLVRQFERDAQAAGIRLISLHCLHDLEANTFWKLMGFRRVGIERGAKGPLIHWCKRIVHAEDLGNPEFVPPAIPLRTHPCPMCRRSTTRTFGPSGQIYKTCRACTNARRQRAL